MELNYEHNFFLKNPREGLWKVNLNLSVKMRFEVFKFLQCLACMLERMRDI